ncbi:neutral zinc metallopeptidase [Amycolatopsis anabasis]|uniref:neutral zinc metallopeptidase n=1 Tax=Amycolatopsis anabasis TaxID=1840409 RepID=UPI001FEC51E4|nr:neutral zinc metallopeptidase [Amycolatopsis anabasis]
MAPPPGPVGAPPGFGPPPPGWGQFGYGHFGRLPAKKSSTGPVVAVCLAAVMLLGLGVVAVVGLTGSSHQRVADAGYSEYPTSSSSEESSSSTESSSDTATSETDESTSSRESSTRRTADDEPERPRGPQPVKRLADHPMFASSTAGLQNIACSLSRWATDQASAQRFFQSAIACLDRVWQPLLAGFNLPFSSPRLTVPNSVSESSTPCGGGGTTTGRTPFYCPRNNTIYMPMDRIELNQWGNRPGPYLAMLAHEYGHHVETLSGVMDAYAEQRYEAGADSAAGLELSRRLELQAQCYSGMFVGSSSVAGGSVDRNIFNEAANSQNRGDDYNPTGRRDHGSANHNIAWWQHGSSKNRTQQCNTWASSSGDVS